MRRLAGRRSRLEPSVATAAPPLARRWRWKPPASGSPPVPRASSSGPQSSGGPITKRAGRAPAPWVSNSRLASSLVGGAGHHHRAVLQGQAQAMGSRSSLTMPWALVRSAWASTGRPWVSSRVMAVRKAASGLRCRPPAAGQQHGSDGRRRCWGRAPQRGCRPQGPLRCRRGGAASGPGCSPPRATSGARWVAVLVRAMASSSSPRSIPGRQVEAVPQG